MTVPKITGTRARYINAARFVSGELAKTADLLDNHVTDCPHAKASNLLVSIELRRLSRIVLGDIGEPEEQEEWQIEPLTTPVPEQPKVPV